MIELGGSVLDQIPAMVGRPACEKSAAPGCGSQRRCDERRVCVQCLADRRRDLVDELRSPRVVIERCLDHRCRGRSDHGCSATRAPTVVLLVESVTRWSVCVVSGTVGLLSRCDCSWTTSRTRRMRGRGSGSATSCVPPWPHRISARLSTDQQAINRAVSDACVFRAFRPMDVATSRDCPTGSGTTVGRYAMGGRRRRSA